MDEEPVDSGGLVAETATTTTDTTTDTTTMEHQQPKVEQQQEQSSSSAILEAIEDLDSSMPDAGTATTTTTTSMTNTTTTDPTTTNTTTTAENQQPKAEQQQKQSSSSSILEAIEDFDSSIPDAVVHHFIHAAGMQTSDQRIVRLISVAAQKFVHDIVSDSLQHCKLRGAQGKKTKEKKYTLAIEDLSAALAEYGIEVRRQQYFN